jgi:hypothetical protein
MDIEGYEPVACRSMLPLLRAACRSTWNSRRAFYGPAADARLHRHAAGFYDTCLVFFEDEEKEMKVIDLPGDIDQYDVCFCPDQRRR